MTTTLTGQVIFSPVRSYNGWRQFEARRQVDGQLGGGDALLVVRQTIPGAKTWDVLHRYWSSPTGMHPAMRIETLARALSRQEAKALAVKMLMAAAGIEPGGRIMFKDGHRPGPIV